jgi:hypothetical protein
VVVETPQGFGYRVALDARSAESLRRGDLVSIATRPVQSVGALDRAIERAAAAHGGRVSLEEAGDGAAERDAVGRRLAQLKRLGLATEEGTGRWRVATDLVPKLEELAARSPRQLVVQRDPQPLAQQIEHRGPTWLDRVPTGGLAPYGFGVDVRAALERRAAVLRGWGLDPADPARLGALHGMERRAIGEALAAKIGQRFVERTPDGFRGRVQSIDAPGGDRYVAISDGRTLAVVRATGKLRREVGRIVVLERGGRVRPEVGTPERER